jgi:hypothetical protein
MKTTLGLAVLTLLTLAPFRAHAADPGEEHVKLFEQFSDLVDKDKGDCDKMATDLNKFLDDHQAELKAQKEKGAQLSPEQRQASMEKYKDRFQAGMQKMRGGMMACHQNPNVQAAMKRMHEDTGGGGGMHGPHGHP